MRPWMAAARPTIERLCREWRPRRRSGPLSVLGRHGCARPDRTDDGVGTAQGAMRIAAFTPGGSVPSARFRVRQYVAPLAETGIRLEEMATATSSYPPAGRA